MDDLEQVDDYYRTVPQNAAADYKRFDDLGLHISAEDKHNFETDDDHSVVQLEATPKVQGLPGCLSEGGHCFHPLACGDSGWLAQQGGGPDQDAGQGSGQGNREG